MLLLISLFYILSVVCQNYVFGGRELCSHANVTRKYHCVLAFLFLKEIIKSRDRIVCSSKTARTSLVKESTLSDMEQADSIEGSSLTLHCIKAFISLIELLHLSPFSDFLLSQRWLALPSLAFSNAFL